MKNVYGLKYFKRMFQTFLMFKTFFSQKAICNLVLLLFVLKESIVINEYILLLYSRHSEQDVFKFVNEYSSMAVFQTFRTSWTRRRQREPQLRTSYLQQRKRSLGSRWTFYRWLSKWPQYRMSSRMRKKRYTVPGFIDNGNINPVSELKHIETHRKIY